MEKSYEMKLNKIMPQQISLEYHQAQEGITNSIERRERSTGELAGVTQSHQRRLLKFSKLQGWVGGGRFALWKFGAGRNTGSAYLFHEHRNSDSERMHVSAWLRNKTWSSCCRAILRPRVLLCLMVAEFKKGRYHRTTQ